MITVSYTEFRDRLATHLDEANNSRAPVTVTRQGRDKRNVVVIDADEFASMEETIHLLRSPANAANLLESIDQANRGLAVERDLVVPTEAALVSKRKTKSAKPA